MTKRKRQEEREGDKERQEGQIALSSRQEICCCIIWRHLALFVFTTRLITLLIR